MYSDKLTKDEIKNIKILEGSLSMADKSRKQALLKKSPQSVIDELVDSEKNIIAAICNIDRKYGEELVAKIEENDIKKDEVSELEKMAINDDDTVFESLDKINKKEAKHSMNAPKEEKQKKEYRTSEKCESIDEIDKGNIIVNDKDENAQYDVIPLPSNGECYPEKYKRVPVGYMTAFDENFILSPNLYQDGIVMDYLLRNKVMSKEIDIDNLCKGDTDAILLFLRATSYGTDYPVTVTDPIDGNTMDYDVDLSKFKYKKFKLKGDSEGYFDYKMPIGKENVKFKFLTRKDERNLEKLSRMEKSGEKPILIGGAIDVIEGLIDDDSVLDNDKKESIRGFIEVLNEWKVKLKEDNSRPYSKMVTDRLEMQIISVNGNKDRKAISSFVKNLNVKDAASFRKYVNDNEPGVDWKFEVKRPKSLGGGSFETFLGWTDTAFLNVK